jgi:hypothetical protein
MKVLFDTVKLVHSSFCKAPEVFYSIDMDTISLTPFIFTMNNSIVYCQNSRNNYFRQGRYRICYPQWWVERLWRISRCMIWYTVGNDFCINFSISFEYSKYRLFPSSSTSFKFSFESSNSLRSKITFIYFYLSHQLQFLK